MTRVFSSIGILFLTATLHAAADPPLADAVVGILSSHCASCHGGNGKEEGGLGYILDLAKLVANNYIVPNNLDKSYLYQRAAVTRDMPPGKLAKLTPDEAAVLAQWITSGAPPQTVTDPGGVIVAPADLLHQAVADLETIAPSDRRLIRYLSLQHIANLLVTRRTAPADRTAQLAQFRKGMAKALNSLSLGPKTVDLHPVGDGGTLFRLTLSDYGWDHDTWEKIIAKNPFDVQQNSFDQRKANSYTGTLEPIVRGDWFVSAITVPPLYYQILGLPDRDTELERQLGVDVAADLDDFTAQRAGFIQSGVSQNNRVIERHPLKQYAGAYWKSYDFVDNKGTDNILEFPLGPVGFAQNFTPAAGEIIWTLPNGLQAYFLIQDNFQSGQRFGKRIDTALTTIVSDPQRPDKLVIDGLSCMSCHATGMKPYRGDVIRAHVQSTNPELFQVVSRLYPPDDQMFALVSADATRFANSLAPLGIHVADPEPVVAIVLYYEEALDLDALAFEIGVTPDALVQAIQHSDTLSQTIGYLETPGKTIKRETLQGIFQELLNELSRQRR